MQESLAEITLARLPLVVLNMARAPGRLLAGHAGRRPRRLPPPRAGPRRRRRGGRAGPAGLPPGGHLAQPGRRDGRLLPGPHGPGGGRRPARARPVRRRPTGRSTGRERRVGPGQARLVPRARSSSATTWATTWPCTTRACAEHTAAMLPRGRAAGRGGASSTTPTWWWWRSARRARTCAPRCDPCGRRASRVGWVRPVTLVPFPDRRRRRRRRGGPRRSPSTRTTPAR